jgi:hypothetical protein
VLVQPSQHGVTRVIIPANASRRNEYPVACDPASFWASAVLTDGCRGFPEFLSTDNTLNLSTTVSFHNLSIDTIYSLGSRHEINYATGWTAWVLYPAEARVSSTASRPALRPTQPPIQWVPEALSPGVKRQERESDHSLPSSAEVKNGRPIPPLPYTSSGRGA